MQLENKLQQLDSEVAENSKHFQASPPYDPENYYKDIARDPYFHSLLIFRHAIKLLIDSYFTYIQNAINVDLFMLTPSVSSPMGPGSDSEAISITFGQLETFLVDSSQFGFEPLLLNNFKKVYCYLPSMRGEDPDTRHLNQFFHCEAEIVGTIEEVRILVDDFIKYLAKGILLMPKTLTVLSENSHKSTDTLNQLLDHNIVSISFEEAVELLEKSGNQKLINYTKKGRDISSAGELILMKLLHTTMPIWINNYDRDRVPFYQKPNFDNFDTVINGDMLFPPIVNGSFGGEIVGAGQRQDSPEEIYESLKRQDNIPPDPYEWYIDLRRLPEYQTTSGFGLGIERFIAWILAKNNIRDVIPYPRLKNIKTYP